MHSKHSKAFKSIQKHSKAFKRIEIPIIEFKCEILKMFFVYIHISRWKNTSLILKIKMKIYSNL